MRQGRSEAEGFNPLSDCGTIELTVDSNAAPSVT
jgi:hypothetical protein